MNFVISALLWEGGPRTVLSLLKKPSLWLGNDRSVSDLLFWSKVNERAMSDILEAAAYLDPLSLGHFGR